MCMEWGGTAHSMMDDRVVWVRADDMRSANVLTDVPMLVSMYCRRSFSSRSRTLRILSWKERSLFCFRVVSKCVSTPRTAPTPMYAHSTHTHAHSPVKRGVREQATYAPRVELDDLHPGEDLVRDLYRGVCMCGIDGSACVGGRSEAYGKKMAE